MTKMIWFDFGGVLSPPIADLFADYERRTGVPTRLLQRAMAEVAQSMSLPTLAPIELGLLTEREWVERIKQRIRAIDPLVDTSAMAPDFGEQWFAQHSPNVQMRSLALASRAEDVRVGILTNNVPEWDAHWRTLVDLEGHVDDVVDSSAVGWRKPDPWIFELAAKRNNVAPGQCLLIDDLEENCRAARQQGWTAVWFTEGADVEAAVRDFIEN